MCSPTRASLLTGLNHHMAGMATVPHGDPGFPGYAFELRDNAVLMPEVFRDAGWATLMLGKWHLTKDSHLSDGAPKASWPLQRGFDRYYGILDAFTNFHQPHRLYEDNHHIDVDDYPDDYFFSDDLTDQAMRMVDELRSSHPTKPFFMYFAHGAVHAPLQAPAADIERFRGRFDEGWDALRAERFERQRELGVVPPDAVLPARNTEERHEVGPWDELDDRHKELFARYMEVYAGMVHNVDRNFGRLRRHLETIGEWDNTIVLFTSDNGGSREGQYTGTSAYFRTLLSMLWNTDLEEVDVDYGRIDLLGGPRTLCHYPMGWAMVSCTPFRLYKINTHRGRPQRAAHRQLAGPVPARKRASRGCSHPVPARHRRFFRPWPSCAGWRFPPPATASPRPNRPGPASRPRSATPRRRPPTPSSTTRCLATAATTGTGGRW